MMKFKNLYIAFLLCCLSLSVQAQKPKIEGRLGATEILIGEHVPLTVTVEAQKDANVQFPTETLLPLDVECLGSIINPDENLGNGRLRQSRTYVLTSFVDTIYVIPSFKVMVDTTVYETNPIPLKVLSVDVDTTFVEQYNGPKYNGPKDVEDVEFNWEKDGWTQGLVTTTFLPWLAALFIFIVYRLLLHKPIVRMVRVIKRELPHLKAMRSINQIKAEKLSASDDQKTYYTKLTDTLRQYINERYGFNAMEMTSAEIIDRLNSTDDPKSLDELRQLFLTADLVKFAKYSTLLGENDANLVNAIDFINQTKKEDMPTKEIIKPELTDDEQRFRKGRIVMMVVALLLAAAVLGTMVYIGFYLYDLL